MDKVFSDDILKRMNWNIRMRWRYGPTQRSKRRQKRKKEAEKNSVRLMKTMEWQPATICKLAAADTEKEPTFKLLLLLSLAAASAK